MATVKTFPDNFESAGQHKAYKQRQKDLCMRLMHMVNRHLELPAQDTTYCTLYQESDGTWHLIFNQVLRFEVLANNGTILVYLRTVPGKDDHFITAFLPGGQDVDMAGPVRLMAGSITGIEPRPIPYVK